jgi:hypothetical protein
MPGAFTHLTIADSAAAKSTLAASLDPNRARVGYALGMYKQFVSLGAVSPDCPYLVLGDHNAAGWGNAMHYHHPADFLLAGINYFSATPVGLLGEEKLKALAWLFGYASHVVADLAIHPILNANDLDYATHPNQHRQCELYQDVFITLRKQHVHPSKLHALNVIRIGCCGLHNAPGIEPEVANLWAHCLQTIAPPTVLLNGSPGPSGPPDPSEWFTHYTRLLGSVVDGSSSILCLFRPLLLAAHVTVPTAVNGNSPFVKGLLGSTTGPIDYEPLVERTTIQVLARWDKLAAAIADNAPGLLQLANANLDTGFIDSSNTPAILV